MRKLLAALPLLALAACSGARSFVVDLPDGTQHVTVISERADPLGVNIGSVTSYHCEVYRCNLVPSGPVSSDGIAAVVGGAVVQTAPLYSQLGVRDSVNVEQPAPQPTAAPAQPKRRGYEHRGSW